MYPPAEARSKNESFSREKGVQKRSLTQRREDRFVDLENDSKGAIWNIHGREIGQKVVAHEETKEDEVVDDFLKVVLKVLDLRLHRVKFQLQKLAQGAQVQQEEFLLLVNLFPVIKGGSEKE